MFNSLTAEDTTHLLGGGGQIRQTKKGTLGNRRTLIEMKHVTVIALATSVLRAIYAKIRCVRHSAHKQIKKGGKTATYVCLSSYELWRSHLSSLLCGLLGFSPMAA